MNYYQIGKKDGKDQYEMDKLTETDRGGEILIYTAVRSEHFEMALDRLSLSQYVGGFVEGYLSARFRLELPH
jgi:hypothetical protein